MSIFICPTLKKEFIGYTKVPYQNTCMLPWASCCMTCLSNAIFYENTRRGESGFRTLRGYYVKSGDTLYKIALKYNTTADALVKANNLTSIMIYPGQYLIIPGIILPYGIYRIGSRGIAVTRIQQALSSMGLGIRVDGIYGRNTEEVIRSIQMKFPDIKADGIYGPNTRAHIQRLLDAGYRIVYNPGSIIALVNKLNALPYYYIPPDLTVPDIPFSFEEFLPQKQMRQAAAGALELLIEKAGHDNINLVGISGYRSYERQAEIFARNYKKSPDEAVKFSARPGESEHQTGLAMDLSSISVNYQLVQSFGDTKEGQWLKKNAPDFGFIIRYPKGKEYITGYQYEPWHVRYIGVPVSQMIAQKGLTLEEYLGR